MTSKNLITGYASAYVSVVEAEGNFPRVRSELRVLSEALSSNEDLRSALSDRLVDPSVRNKIVDDLLANKTSDVTRALVGMTVSSGHGSRLSEIISSFIDQAAERQGGKIATVRSVVALSDVQKAKLAEVLKASEGTDIQIENIIDPELVGGVVTSIGDKVIDGSLRSKLEQMREAL